jgi:hypothetical protein
MQFILCRQSISQICFLRPFSYVYPLPETVFNYEKKFKKKKLVSPTFDLRYTTDRLSFPIVAEFCGGSGR